MRIIQIFSAFVLLLFDLIFSILFAVFVALPVGIVMLIIGSIADLDKERRENE